MKLLPCRKCCLMPVCIEREAKERSSNCVEFEKALEFWIFSMAASFIVSFVVGLIVTFFILSNVVFSSVSYLSYPIIYLVLWSGIPGLFGMLLKTRMRGPTAFIFLVGGVTFLISFIVGIFVERKLCLQNQTHLM